MPQNEIISALNRTVNVLSHSKMPKPHDYNDTKERSRESKKKSARDRQHFVDEGGSGELYNDQGHAMEDVEPNQYSDRSKRVRKKNIPVLEKESDIRGTYEELNITWN